MKSFCWKLEAKGGGGGKGGNKASNFEPPPRELCSQAVPYVLILDKGGVFVCVKWGSKYKINQLGHWHLRPPTTYICTYHASSSKHVVNNHSITFSFPLFILEILLLSGQSIEPKHFFLALIINATIIIPCYLLLTGFWRRYYWGLRVYGKHAFTLVLSKVTL